MAKVLPEAREVAAMLPYYILRYLARAVGEDEAEQVRVAAGEARTMEQLADPGAWSSEGSALAVAEAAARLTGDAHIGRRGGEERLRDDTENGLTDLWLAEGSVAAALDAVIAMSSRVTTLGQMTVADRAEDSILVERRYQPGVSPHAVWCDFAIGYWAGVPTLFGAAGYAVELECRARGDARCLTRVSWVHDHLRGPDVGAARGRSRRLIGRFEQLQSMAADLMAAKDVATVLDLVVERAGHAVFAPRFLVAVRLDDGAELQVHHDGFADDDSARAAAEAILSGQASTSTLFVDVASTRRDYGRIAALYPEGTEGNEVDRQLLSAYAGLVVAALEAAVAFEQAHRDRDTAQALLDLAGTLAQAGTAEEVAARLASALPAIAGSPDASVWLWEPADRLLRLAASSHADLARLPKTLSVDEWSGLADLVENPQPVLLDADGLTGNMREVMAAVSTRHGSIVPIVARGTFLGLVAIGFRRPLADNEQARLLERLTGFADQAAAALDNAHLVEDIRHQSLHDALTGLPNRPLIADRANQAIAGRSLRRVGLLFIDLDRFKDVNDTLGHRAGDDIIRQVAARLQGAVRAADTLARLGGDEFIVLLPEVDDEDAAVAVATRVIDVVRTPFDFEGRQLFISCSIGVAVASASGGDYETLLQHADAAMYEAKAQGRNTVAAYSAVPASPRRHRLELESALHLALDNHELAVAYQPQVELDSGRIVGVEALVRWHHPTLGTIGPNVFIPIAEDTGLIVAIDRWVRHTALAQARSWRDAGLPPIRVALNLSARELRSPALASDLAADIAESGVPPELVEIEITERVVLADSDDLCDILNALAATGARLAIDDFGTGSSVLSRLQGFPFHTIKIDQSFINGITTETSVAVIAALVQMGTILGLEVVAEGVETELQRAALITLGCPLAQGFLFSRPVTPEVMSGLLLRGHLDGERVPDPAGR